MKLIRLWVNPNPSGGLGLPTPEAGAAPTGDRPPHEDRSGNPKPRAPAAPRARYSLLSASTGSRWLAELAGMMPAMSVSATEMSTSTAADVAGSCMICSTP